MASKIKNTSNMFQILSSESINLTKKEKKQKKEKKEIQKTLYLTATKPFVCGSWADDDDEPLDFTQPLHIPY